MDNKAMGGLGGNQYAGQCEKRPEYTYETAARLWSSAKERRDRADRDLNTAQAEAEDARRQEIEAWKNLQNEAGRGEPEPSNPQPPLRGYGIR